ncbi:MAG TPA: TIGR03557 family F420-dependent LLM class oxidoreductase [Gaiellaceae bacterium]|jgi:coenzyme F420-dependent glucose-6-phosphate dehydrogenase|nr:TIGR03557 family F420-dependent LLM class oxidoreductase [Gaiellaceae bacterium]
MRVFYGAAHEQFPPDAALRHSQLAVQAGFDGVYCSDHFQPWWEPGESGHAWPWVGALCATTDNALIGTAVTPAVRRYHPALIAQCWATLEVMFPGRVFLGCGSGESLNESPFGFDWPSGAEQLEMMDEALDMIRRLWNGETIATGSKHFKTKNAKLHTRPPKPPPIYVSAFHEGAAKVAAKYGDGLWTLGDPEMAPRVIETYKSAGGTGEIVLQALVSWGETDDAALEGVRKWKGSQPFEYYVEDWHDPQTMYEHAEETISDDAYKQMVVISSDPAEHVERLSALKELGATSIGVMNGSGADPEGAVKVYGEQVLPKLREL